MTGQPTSQCFHRRICRVAPARLVTASVPNAFDFFSNTDHSQLSLIGNITLYSSKNDHGTLLHDEQAAALDALRSINGRINMAAPVSRLPPELLARIFAYYAKDDMIWRKKKPGIGWISVTHVCRRWRHVALGDSRLWSHIFLPLNTMLLEEFISRSKVSPLSVSWISGYTYSTPWRPNPWPTELALTSLVRVERLHFDNFDGDAEGLYSLLSSPAPILEEAQILGLSIPKNVFGGSAPNLRHLSIRESMHFPWGSGALSSIVSLNIEYSLDLRPPRPSQADVMKALHKMPFLEQLSLIRCLPKSFATALADTDTFIPEPPIFAPARLQKLTLSGEVQECIGFFHHTSFPDSGVRLDLTCITLDHAINFQPLVRSLSVACGSTSGPFTCFNFEAHSRRTFKFQAKRASDEGGDDDAEPSVALNFVWRASASDGWNAVDLMQAVCLALSVTHLTDLEVDIDEFPEEYGGDDQAFTPAVWANALGPAKELVRIAIYGSAAHSFCPVLLLTTPDGHSWQEREAMEPASDDDQDTTTLFFPQLRWLSMFPTDWMHLYPGEDLHLYEFLPLLLRLRDEGRAPRVSLEVATCSQALEDVLKPLVVKLNVITEDEDGDDGVDSEDGDDAVEG
ncbi:hypothetical protein BV25DRAFT_759335 [Artomyces pyxidatus]|uniref:Uncharacterized protein n=1 Tax=Artomyces pyxidatus TaxID=48021 RepID=A0ACB8T089_9AGAM|nr:hypothetical protein BV25DRAFT_759335 [Artomyces pyxidatus]